MLGDANLNKRFKNCNLKFDYSQKYSAYAHHITDVFRHWFLSLPTERPRINSEYVGLGFQTISSIEFNFLKDLFYFDNHTKKSIKENLIKDYLTPIGLAYWICDDGGLTDYTRKRGLEIHTGGFTEDEVSLKVEQLSEKFNLNCWKAHNRKYPIIRFSNSEDVKLTKMIKPYFIKEMYRKLPDINSIS